ncbi:MAG: tRNA lysidine(34) synthetase TilS [Paracoccaceae bacterium]
MSVNDITAGLEATLAGISNENLGVAVSGGSDSVALLHLLAARGTGLRAISIDHGLRPESGDEMQHVAQLCAALSVPHTIATWQDWDGAGNLQAAARHARQSLIKDWAQKAGITHVALGHTLDDQAETVLLRLARGSGVDGLSGMADLRNDGQLIWVRPLLHARRADLRIYLQSQGIAWADDPSNEDIKYDRVKARRALAVLADIGIDAKGLSTTANTLRRARHVLENATRDLADQCVTITKAGEVRLDLQVFDAALQDLQYRLLAGVLQWISGAPYRPRFESLRKVLENAAQENGQTLHGCVIRSQSGNLIVRREPSKANGACIVGEKVWDNRWEIGRNNDADTADTIAALGDKGLLQCKNWRETGHAREVLLTTPALWKGTKLIAAPLAGMANGWYCRLNDAKNGLHKVLITH